MTPPEPEPQITYTSGLSVEQELLEKQRKEFKSPLDLFIEHNCSLCSRYLISPKVDQKYACSTKDRNGLLRMTLCVRLLFFKEGKGY